MTIKLITPEKALIQRVKVEGRECRFHNHPRPIRERALMELVKLDCCVCASFVAAVITKLYNTVSLSS